MAGAYQPRSLWEKRLAPTVPTVGLWRDRLWYLEAGQLCSPPTPPPGSCQAVWFLPSVGERNYVVASHILWYVCLMASLCGSKSSTVLSRDPEGPSASFCGIVPSPYPRVRAPLKVEVSSVALLFGSAVSCALRGS